MGPRKRPILNAKAEAESVSEEAPLRQRLKEQTKDSVNPQSLLLDGSKDIKSGYSSIKSLNAPASSKNWYGGTWPRGNKANPVTQVAKESISAAGGVACETLASARAYTPELPTAPLRSPAVYLSKSIGNTSRPSPSVATTTQLHITSNSKGPTRSVAESGEIPKNERDASRDSKAQNELNTVLATEKSGDATPTKPRENCHGRPEPNTQGSEVPKVNNETTRWLNWFSKSEIAKEDKGNIANSNGDVGSADEHGPQQIAQKILQDSSTSTIQHRNSNASLVSPSVKQVEASRPWLSLWGNAPTQTRSSSSASAIGVASHTINESNTPVSEQGKVTGVELNPVPTTQPSQQPADGTKSPNGWAFWSRGEPKSGDEKTRPGNKIWEPAPAESSSQSWLESAVVDKARERSPNGVEKRQGSQPLKRAEDPKRPRGFGDDTQKLYKPEAILLGPEIKAKVDINSKEKRLPGNLLLPALRATYSTIERPSLIQQISKLLQMSTSSEPKHVNIAHDPPLVKRALAIGVHGYFPAPLIRSVLGQPTGTSIRFANGAASAIQKWTQNRGYSCDIEKVALEGEGKISERIDLLWKLMLNWIESIRRADFVMIACHSQGVPVAMMLVAKLIDFGCVNSAKIGVCAMAGVNLGPFADYKSRWISGSAGELFDFAHPCSQVSMDYEAALDVSLRFGVKIVYVGSLDDQLVSLESSTFGSVSHPHIYRAVFVDGRVHAPDFISHLVGFVLKLRNLGISDHGLIRELSGPLAGSLYGGEGHSRIYDDEAGYFLAVEHALETTSLGETPPRFHHEGVTTSQNPYMLPFAMRGVLEENYVRTELYGEIAELIQQFDEWKPSTKALKDVKFRLEGVRSKI